MATVWTAMFCECWLPAVHFLRFVLADVEPPWVGRQDPADLCHVSVVVSAARRFAACLVEPCQLQVVSDASAGGPRLRTSGTPEVRARSRADFNRSCCPSCCFVDRAALYELGEFLPRRLTPLSSFLAKEEVSERCLGWMRSGFLRKVDRTMAPLDDFGVSSQG